MDLHLERPNTVKLKGLEFRCPKTVVGTVQQMQHIILQLVI